MANDIKIELATFNEVCKVWSRELWPGRVSPIESNSAMTWLGGIDMQLMQARPTFWRVVGKTEAQNDNESQTLGVLSGHFGGLIDLTTVMDDAAVASPQRPERDRSYRTRGLWVADRVRRNGVAQMLMKAAFEQARKEDCLAVWTFPRESSMPFYESSGFKRVGPWLGVDDPGAGEFGPNCYAIANL